MQLGLSHLLQTSTDLSKKVDLLTILSNNLSARVMTLEKENSTQKEAMTELRRLFEHLNSQLPSATISPSASSLSCFTQPQSASPARRTSSMPFDVEIQPLSYAVRTDEPFGSPLPPYSMADLPSVEFSRSNPSSMFNAPSSSAPTSTFDSSSKFSRSPRPLESSPMYSPTTERMSLFEAGPTSVSMVSSLISSNQDTSGPSPSAQKRRSRGSNEVLRLRGTSFGAGPGLPAIAQARWLSQQQVCFSAFGMLT